TVTDPSGRQVTYTHDTGGRVTQISTLGAGANTQTWTLTWTTKTWNPAVTFTGITCLTASGSTCPKTMTAVPCPTRTYTTLTSMTIPDGRSYQFSYDLNLSDPTRYPTSTNSWGALAQVTTPDGAVYRMKYSPADPWATAGGSFGGTAQLSDTTIYAQGLTGTS